MDILVAFDLQTVAELDSQISLPSFATVEIVVVELGYQINPPSFVIVEDIQVVAFVTFVDVDLHDVRQHNQVRV